MEGDEERSLLKKVTLRFIAAVSLLSFLYSCFSGYNNNIQFSTLVFSLFAHSLHLDRKYMFFICNGIVAVLVKNLTFTSSSSTNTAQDYVAQENAASSVEDESSDYGIGAQEEMEEEMKVEDEDQENIGEEEISVEMKVEDESTSDYEEEMEVKEESVSTEELNHKIEEFIRKTKEEIWIEAQQQ